MILLSKILKGEGGILLNSYKVVEIFVHIIYESTLGVYGKALGISRPEKKNLEFSGFPCLTQGWIIFWAFSPNFAVFSQNPKLIFGPFKPIKSYQAVIGVKRMARGVSLAPRNDHNYILVQYNSKYRAKMG